MTLEFVLNLRDQPKNGKIDVREIVPVVETEEDFEEEAVEKDYEELRVKTLDSLNAVRKVSASLKDLYDKARHVGADPEKQKKLRKQIDTVRGQVVDKMESVNLHGVLKDRMTQRVRDLNLLFRQAEREVTSCQRRLGVGGEAGLSCSANCVARTKICWPSNGEPACPKRCCKTSRSTIRRRGRVRQLEEEEALVSSEEIKDAVKHLDVAEKVKRGRQSWWRRICVWS